MAAPDWLALRVVLNERAAIYAESFPAWLDDLGSKAVDLFTHEEAQGLLFTFAGAWPTLGRETTDPSTRFVNMDLSGLVCRHRGVELAPGAIVIDDVAGL